MIRPARRDRNGEVDFRGERRSNATHASTTDPDARLYKKSPGTGAILCFMGHTLMENRSGLVVQADLTQADAHAERRAALAMVHRHSPGSTRRLTLGADKGYDSADFVTDLRQACVTPHVAQKARHSAIDGRTTRHKGHALSQKRRKKIEEPFGWAKTVGGMAQTVYRGVERVRARFTLTTAACNLARLPRPLAAS
jgi:IS5 family transposase